jgi:hypothetical protein
MQNLFASYSVVFHTCHESREEFLHKEGTKKNHYIYKLCGGMAKLREVNKIYIFRDIDVLVIGIAGELMFFLIMRSEPKLTPPRVFIAPRISKTSGIWQLSSTVRRSCSAFFQISIV